MWTRLEYTAQISENLSISIANVKNQSEVNMSEICKRGGSSWSVVYRIGVVYFPHNTVTFTHFRHATKFILLLHCITDFSLKYACGITCSLYHMP